MAVEARRGCGYRKVGGLYLVSGVLAAPCGRLPLELEVCPACNAGIKQTRAWQWVKPQVLFAGAPSCAYEAPLQRHIVRGVAVAHERVSVGADCRDCPLAPPNLPATAGLIWVGEKFYSTPSDFMGEAHRLGISRRIAAIPRNFQLGETWVLIGHPCAIHRAPATPEEREEVLEDGIGDLRVTRKGIIAVFRPTAVEKIVTESQARDKDAMAELARKGITPVVVPDDDRDHQGSVYDDEPQLELE